MALLRGLVIALCGLRLGGRAGQRLRRMMRLLRSCGGRSCGLLSLLTMLRIGGMLLGILVWDCLVADSWIG